MRKITDIVIHCTATRAGVPVTVADIDRWHKHRGFAGIGYHYVVGLNGEVSKGRPEWKIGAHVKGHNRNSIGVVYVGGLDENMKPTDTRTEAQKKALILLLFKLKERHPNACICGHRDFSKDLNKNGVIEPFEWIKVCPCFNAINEYNDL